MLQETIGPVPCRVRSTGPDSGHASFDLPRLPFKDAVKKAGITELSHRAERKDDYEGYWFQTPEFSVGKHGIGARIAVLDRCDDDA